MANWNYNKNISPSRYNATKLNIDKFKSILSYFSYLQMNGEISDKAFEALVRYACDIFIENELEIVIREVIERKLIKFLTSKLSTEVEETEETEGTIASLDLSRIIMRSR